MLSIDYREQTINGEHFPSSFRFLQTVIKMEKEEERLKTEEEREISEWMNIRMERLKSPMQWVTDTLQKHTGLLPTDDDNVIQHAVACFRDLVGGAVYATMRREYFAEIGETFHNFCDIEERVFISWCLAVNEKRFWPIWATSLDEGRRELSNKIPIKRKTTATPDKLRKIVQSRLHPKRKINIPGFLITTCDEGYFRLKQGSRFKRHDIFVPCTLINASAERSPVSTICDMVEVTTEHLVTGKCVYASRNVKRMDTETSKYQVGITFVRKFKTFASTWNKKDWTPYTRGFVEKITNN